MKKRIKPSLTPNERFMLLVAIGLITAAFLLGCCGPQGQAGLQGKPGVSAPSIYTLPASLSECSTGGTVVYVGAAETIVCNGLQGSTGATGSTGSTGTLVEIVQFCPGTPAYGNFMEVGIKIGTDIYAVYSANNGFLTRLLPGNYVTTATGLNCNFTVNADGTITY